MTSPHQSRPGNARNGQRHAHPTCWVTDTHEYALVTRADWHSVIWRRTIGGGTWSSYDLSGTVIGLVDVHVDDNNNMDIVFITNDTVY